MYIILFMSAAKSFGAKKIDEHLSNDGLRTGRLKVWALELFMIAWHWTLTVVPVHSSVLIFNKVLLLYCELCQSCAFYYNSQFIARIYCSRVKHHLITLLQLLAEKLRTMSITYCTVNHVLCGLVLPHYYMVHYINSIVHLESLNIISIS